MSKVTENDLETALRILSKEMDNPHDSEEYVMLFEARELVDRALEKKKLP